MDEKKYIGRNVTSLINIYIYFEKKTHHIFLYYIYNKEIKFHFSFVWTVFCLAAAHSLAADSSHSPKIFSLTVHSPLAHLLAAHSSYSPKISTPVTSHCEKLQKFHVTKTATLRIQTLDIKFRKQNANHKDT